MLPLSPCVASSTTDPDVFSIHSTLTSPIITLVVGREPRIFAAHEDVLSLSPFFTAALKGQFYESASKRVALPDE